MTVPRDDAGLTLVELTVATALALAMLATLTALLAVIVRARGRAGEVAETMVGLAGTIDQIARDVRLAGYDPVARGITGIVTPTAQSVVLRADLDGSGDIDASSEEQITYRLNAAGDTLQRLVGQQNLPLLSDVAPGGLRLHYFDAAAAELDPSAPDAPDRVHLITIELALRATATHAALRMLGGARLLNR
jgi:type II secretory pathway component PulJ